MKNNDCYFWFSSNYGSIYIDPVRTDMNLRIFFEKVIGAERIIPVGTRTLPVVSPLIQSQVADTPYEKMMGISYGEFRRSSNEIAEYALILENNMIVSNLGYGILIENTSASYISSCLGMLLGESFNVESWEAERFYVIRGGVIHPTEHRTKDAMAYVCGLFIPELID
jgi:hypothetical protein